MTYFWIGLICLIMMIIFIIPTLMGGRWHDQQKELRDRAEHARQEQQDRANSADQDSTS